MLWKVKMGAELTREKVEFFLRECIYKPCFLGGMNSHWLFSEADGETDSFCINCFGCRWQNRFIYLGNVDILFQQGLFLETDVHIYKKLRNYCLERPGMDLMDLGVSHKLLRLDPLPHVKTILATTVRVHSSFVSSL